MHFELRQLLDNSCRESYSDIYSLCARGEGERMSRLIGLVGEAGTEEVRIRRSGAGDLVRGLDQRSETDNSDCSCCMSGKQLNNWTF